jgi:hypothetical protein
MLAAARQAVPWSLYILARLDAGKSGQHAMLSTVTTLALYQDTTLSRALKAQTDLGFTVCGKTRLRVKDMPQGSSACVRTAIFQFSPEGAS